MMASDDEPKARLTDFPTMADAPAEVRAKRDRLKRGVKDTIEIYQKEAPRFKEALDRFITVARLLVPHPDIDGNLAHINISFNVHWLIADAAHNLFNAAYRAHHYASGLYGFSAFVAEVELAGEVCEGVLRQLLPRWNFNIEPLPPPFEGIWRVFPREEAEMRLAPSELWQLEDAVVLLEHAITKGDTTPRVKDRRVSPDRMPAPDGRIIPIEPMGDHNGQGVIVWEAKGPIPVAVGLDHCAVLRVLHKAAQEGFTHVKGSDLGKRADVQHPDKIIKALRKHDIIGKHIEPSKGPGRSAGYGFLYALDIPGSGE
jgi:hypothetical protein